MEILEELKKSFELQFSCVKGRNDQKSSARTGEEEEEGGSRGKGWKQF